MEMNQIRYFLATARTLNFTRAAEECHVAQPSLTRAIQQLEAELGGDLFRREHKLSHLTELGQRMLPLIQQCYDMAQGAKSLAGSIKRGEVATLRLGLSDSVDISMALPHLLELTRALKGLELKFSRGPGAEVAEKLKQGDIDLAVTGSQENSWVRFDVWPLFSETFVLLAHAAHRLANSEAVDLEDIGGERLLLRKHCEQCTQLEALLRSRDISLAHCHELSNDRDLSPLLAANFGVAIAPRSLPIDGGLVRVPINKLPLTRSVCLYSVAGRLRNGPSAALIRQMSAADWSAFAA